MLSSDPRTRTDTSFPAGSRTAPPLSRARERQTIVRGEIAVDFGTPRRFRYAWRRAQYALAARDALGNERRVVQLADAYREVETLPARDRDAGRRDRSAASAADAA